MTWDDYPLLLNAHDMAALFRLTVKTIRRRVDAGSPLLPQPALLQPYRWRRDDVKRWIETSSLAHQRRALAREHRIAS